MLNLKNALIVGSVAAFASTVMMEGLAVAQTQSWKPTVLKVNDPDLNDLARVRNGRLRKTDEEFTNEQSVVKFFADGKTGLYVEMRTGALPTGETPVHRMQGACSPVTLSQAADGSIALAKAPGERFVTDNDGNEYRNANKPELMPINNGKNMLYMFNYQPDGTDDTRRYAKVLDAACNQIPVTNANGEARKQVLIMAKNNDDCDMHQTGEGPCDIATDAGGTTHLTCWAGCNGNGDDDGWINDITVACTNDAAGKATACQITKNFDLSLARREERSRGRCSVADADPNTSICAWTEGNNQPQRDGVWLAAVDISPNGEQGPEANSRLLWKEQLADNSEINGRETYSVRMKSTRVLAAGPNGTLTKTDQLFLHWGDLRGRNLDNEKGGTYRGQQIAVVKAGKTGFTYTLPKTQSQDFLLGIDGTHLTMCGAVFGSAQSLMPGFTLMQGSHNGGGVTEPVAKAIGYDVTLNKLVDLGTHRVGGSYDRHMYSNYLGNNPGNQGRNFAGCALFKNPFAGQLGSTTQYFVAHAMTGKSPDLKVRPELKPSSYVGLLPVATTIATTRANLTAESEGSSGCTSTGTAKGADGLCLLAILGLLFATRRRRA